MIGIAEPYNLFLKIIGAMIATDKTGVKFGGWGIILNSAKEKEKNSK